MPESVVGCTSDCVAFASGRVGGLVGGLLLRRQGGLVGGWVGSFLLCFISPDDDVLPCSVYKLCLREG